MESTADKHIRTYDSLKSDRSQLDQYYQQLAYYNLPRKAYITRIKNMGDKIPTDIYDSTAIMSLAYFSAGMQAYMSSPQSRFFALGIKNRQLMNNRNVLNYLKDSEDVLYGMINNSNFYQEDVESYQGIGCFGVDVLYAEDDPLEDLRYDCLPIESVCIVNDHAGRTRTVYMEFEYDCEQAIGKFGQAVGEKVKEAYAKSNFSIKFKYVYCVKPRDVYDISKMDSKNMPYESTWIDRENKRIIKESGFREFPFFISRFAKSKGDPYGYSPAMNILPDVQMLNQMEHSNIVSAQNVARPPLEVPDEAFLRPFDFNPGGINIKNLGYPNEHVTPIATGGNVPVTLDYLQYKQRKVSQAFYNDLFVMMEQKGSTTATEVNIVNNQRMQLLGSAVGNIMRDKLSPVISRNYAVAARKNKLPPLPRELIGQEYIIEYISPLARAQKFLELQNLSSALGIIGQIGAVNPETFDKVDFDKTVDRIANITSIAPDIIRDDGEVEEIRANRAQAQEMAQKMAAVQQGTDIIKTGTEADKNAAQGQQASTVGR